MSSAEPLSLITSLGIALALGMLIGLERGWHERGAAEGERVAGIRTFALIALLGALAALPTGATAGLLVPAAFAGLAILLILAHALQQQRDRDAGITTVVAALATFLLGALAGAGQGAVAVPAAVAISLLLGLKTRLHALVGRLSEAELMAVLKLALISAAALPLIPNRGFGPWGALNPYEIWWMVVLIATLSSAGYFAMRLAGPGRGLLLTGAFGGLVSSTALTLGFARLNRRQPRLAAPLGGAVLLACGMMFPRVWIEAMIVRPAIAPALVPPLITMVVVAGGILLWQRPGAAAERPEHDDLIANPFELRSALIIGALLAAVMVLTEAGRSWFGDEGVYLVATLAALSDVDAITLALARSAGDGIGFDVAKRGIILSAAVNTLVKGGIAAVIGGRALWWRVTLPLLAATTAGLGVAFLT